jgi:hypothetical protein
MTTLGLADIRTGMAKFECLLTEMAAKDALHRHELCQALPRLREARVWVEGALEKDDPIARVERRLREQLFSVDEEPVFGLPDDED